MATPFSRSLQELIKELDADMGEGFCKKHPNLLGRALIASELHYLADTLRTDHPLFGSTLSGMEKGLGRIAEAINEHVSSQIDSVQR
jgi:hypothetical protein